MYDLIASSYPNLPLAAVLNEEIIVLHGGLFSSDTVTLKDIQRYIYN
jgi:hypothetical protein